MNYIFKLPIGDWAKDGHRECEYYILKCNISLEELREVYFETVKKVGAGLDSESLNKFCSEYLDNKITKRKIEELGLNWNNYSELEDIKEGVIYSETFCNLFIDYIITHNSFIKLKLTEDIPMFPFYGFDSKKRHIGGMGYGLFE